METASIKTKKVKKSTRFRQIIKVFLAYNVVPNLLKQTHPEQVRMACEELGSTFIKMGQMLSVRTDFLPSAYIEELKKLQDHVKTDTYPEIRQIMEEELGCPLTEVFASFDEQPIASASMGQIHRAVLHSGETVAVKVQHVGIREEITMDLSLLKRALSLLKHIPESQIVDLKDIFFEIKHSLEQELDGRQEAENGQHFFDLNREWGIIQVPVFYMDYCTTRLVVMECIVGSSIRHFFREYATSNEHEPAALRKAFGDTLVRHFIKQVFEDGFFHADPHPGNIFVQKVSETADQRNETLKDKQFQKHFRKTKVHVHYQQAKPLPPYRLIYLDFGMMGYLDEGMRNKLAAVLDSLYRQNTKATGRAILQVCKQIGPLDEERFYEQLGTFLDRNYERSIGELNIQTLFFEIIAICHENNLQVPQEVTMLVKAVVTFEGMIRELDPTISLMEISAPFAQKYFMETIDWSIEWKRAALDALYSIKAAPQIPSRALDVLDDLAQGKSKINVELKRQDELLNRIEGMVNRLVIGLILSALIIGSSMLVEFHDGLTGKFVSTLGIIGYGLAFLAILFLVYDMWRKYRKKR